MEGFWLVGASVIQIGMLGLSPEAYYKLAGCLMMLLVLLI